MRHTIGAFRAWDEPSWQSDFVAHVIIGPFLASLIGSAGFYVFAVLLLPIVPIWLYQISILPTLAVFFISRMLRETRHLLVKKIAMGATGGFLTLLTLAYRFDFEKYAQRDGGLIAWTVCLAFFVPMLTEKLAREIPWPITIGSIVIGIQFLPGTLVFGLQFIEMLVLIFQPL